jgi:hypothetical protein
MIAPHKKLRIIVGGMVGQFPLGGVAWDYFHYCIGLHQLGHDVYYHEDTWVWPNDPIKGYQSDSADYTVKFIQNFFDRYAPEMAQKWHYRLIHNESYGMTREAFDEVARTADIFLNVSGACFIPESLNPKAVKVFMDTDPGYNQIVMYEQPSWSKNVAGWVEAVRAHDRHLTYAENIYAPDCVVPRLDIDWLPTRCIATLPEWKAVRETPPPAGAQFTTVMSCSYYPGVLEHKGVQYDQKATEYDRFHDLPRRTDVPLTLAVAGWKTPTEQIKKDGWNLIHAQDISLTTDNYVKFIADSFGEWSVAKNVFVATRSGWFSCRTACYLAAGRPAVVQDTAWSRYVPSGEGVIAFSTMDEAIDGLKRVWAEPERHRKAAYDIAREYLAPDKVLPPMLDAIYATPRTNAAAPEHIPPSISKK